MATGILLYALEDCTGDSLPVSRFAEFRLYTTTVTDVTAAGLTWDGITPANEFDK